MPRSRADSIAARRREVRERLDELERELVELRRMREGLNDDDEHDPDGVSLSSEWSRLEGLRQTQLEALAAIDAAAARVERGEDALCSVCGRPIAPERLEARPQATTCIDCARRLEA
ncbi:TraR/DksA C4-type zinc finger protein [Agrococcus sp. HG114]|uniref:TraR/DksA family transcriptional regulator n=1 Tax=Agrococcus sp. HG114 TaxID=2969757 RepID=UPI00215A3109|nr:TraR/DksA C4-type zinc finger protein [Agrococcus sp. HG114]MCR8670798.1 TraR/DksA C4-type zinc finger protein [Agrococcus sp. HG114]